ncbi:MAG: hypothetical protein II841_05985 [Bacteroidales bacterium]|nr:hypothetical protein [Bacteroidales bacterium]
MELILSALPPSAFAIVVLLFTLAYFFVTTLVMRNKPGRLWIPALILLILSTSLYSSSYWLAGVQNWYSNFTMSLSAALDLFLFKLNTHLGRFTDLFYIKPGVNEDPVVLNRMILVCCMYVCSIWTTSVMVMHFFARRLMSKAALAWAWIRRKDRGIHLFIGINPQTISLARSLAPGEKAVFIDLPSPELLPDKLSLSQIFKGVRAGSDQSVRMKEVRKDAVVLKARKPLDQCTEQDLFKDLGLGLLKRWADNPQTFIYLISGLYTDNVNALQKIYTCPAQIYCHAKREGLALRLELIESGHVHIIDSSFLATKALKGRDELYPIHFMDIARDSFGQPLGYVEGSFDALVCGFGEAGQGMLTFLYEFGAFPDKDKQPNEFHCTVVDPHMDVKEGAFRVEHPCMEDSRISFMKDSVGSESFWRWLGENIRRMNYVFVNIGPDNDNMKYAIDILEFAFRNRGGMDKFIVVVKLDHPAAYQELIGYFNQNYGACNVIRSIGDIDRTWTWNNISGADFREDAQTFYKAYAMASGSPVTWAEREKQIMAKPVSDLSKKLELQRKIGQDFINHFHTRVKSYLCPEKLWKDPVVAAHIPLEMEDGKHYTGTDADVAAVLDYLAVGEHLRWKASHEVNGYRKGPKKQEDLKTHTDICPYEELSEQVKHYDWIVVKTTLELLGGSK